jgi:hypothetical protein
MDEHVILVAVQVQADTRVRAHRDVAEFLNASRLGPDRHPFSKVVAWWIAEDDRVDGSDNDSAVFCNPGEQHNAALILHEHGITPEWNIVEPKGGQYA